MQNEINLEELRDIQRIRDIIEGTTNQRLTISEDYFRKKIGNDSLV